MGEKEGDDGHREMGTYAATTAPAGADLGALEEFDALGGRDRGGRSDRVGSDEAQKGDEGDDDGLELHFEGWCWI